MSLNHVLPSPCRRKRSFRFREDKSLRGLRYLTLRWTLGYTCLFPFWLWLVLSWVIQGWQLHPTTSNQPIKWRKPFLYLKEKHFQSVSSGRKSCLEFRAKPQRKASGIPDKWALTLHLCLIIIMVHEGQHRGQHKSTWQGHILNAYQRFYKTVTEL